MEASENEALGVSSPVWCPGPDSVATSREVSVGVLSPPRPSRRRFRIGMAGLMRRTPAESLLKALRRGSWAQTLLEF